VHETVDGSDRLLDDCAFCQGIIAARAGVDAADNPYPPDSEVESAYQLWRFGYRSEGLPGPPVRHR
jgi:hypothetical protein